LGNPISTPILPFPLWGPAGAVGCLPSFFSVVAVLVLVSGESFMCPGNEVKSQFFGGRNLEFGICIRSGELVNKKVWIKSSLLSSFLSFRLSLLGVGSWERWNWRVSSLTESFSPPLGPSPVPIKKLKVERPMIGFRNFHLPPLGIKGAKVTTNFLPSFSGPPSII